MLLEVLLISVEKTVQPWEKFLGAVVSVEDNWDAVCWSNGADVVGTSDTTSDRSLLGTVRDTLSGEVGGTTLRHLEDDWGLGIAGSLKGCNDSGGRGHVLGVSELRSSPWMQW